MSKPDGRRKIILPRKIRASRKPPIGTKNGPPPAQRQNRPAGSQGPKPAGRQPKGQQRPAGRPGPKPTRQQPRGETGPAGRPRRSPRLGVKKMTTVSQKSRATSPKIFLKALAFPCQTKPEPRPLPEMCISLRKMTTFAKMQLNEQARRPPKAHFASQNTCFQRAAYLHTAGPNAPGSPAHSPQKT